MLNRKMIQWVAASVLAGVPAVGLAHSHHVTTAASPLMATSTVLSTSTPSAPARLVAQKQSARKHKATRHHKRGAKKHVKKTSARARHGSKAKLKKA